MPLFPSAFWKGIFWIFMVRQAIVMWVCTIPDVWNTWNTWVFIVAEIIFIFDMASYVPGTVPDGLRE
jgi:hypothetical protein